MKSRISRLSRSPIPRSAADFLARRTAVFAIVGVFVFDNYGVVPDTYDQRLIGRASLDYVLGVVGARGVIRVKYAIIALSFTISPRFCAFAPDFMNRLLRRRAEQVARAGVEEAR